MLEQIWANIPSVPHTYISYPVGNKVTKKKACKLPYEDSFYKAIHFDGDLKSRKKAVKI